MNKVYVSRIRYFFILECLWLASCNHPDIQKEETPESFVELFDAFWHGINANYVFWDIDSTNWDQVYTKFHLKFDQLDIDNEDDVRHSISYFREITKFMIDGHASISFQHPLLFDSLIEPLFERKKSLGLSSRAYDYQLLDTAYLDSGFSIGSDFSNILNGNPLTVITGTIDSNIIFFSCNFFGLSESYYSLNDNIAKYVIKRFFNLLEKEDSRGVIIDVRNNPGGDLADLNFLIGMFIDEPLTIGYSQYKNGVDRLSFTPWISAQINPETRKSIEVPIIVLGDNYSASLSEMVISAIQTMPKGVFIGETTFGATSPVIPFEIYNSGSFDINGFLNVRLSSGKFKNLNDDIFEGRGVPPDVVVRHSSNNFFRGIDTQLTYCLQYLDNILN
ncbi:MAG: S41 family peptidase [Bacteroidota bacterium]